MESKAAPPAAGLDLKRLPAPLGAYLQLIHLKQLFRRGWLQRGVAPARCESVAEHSFGVALLALLLADAAEDEIDRERLLRMALVHDLGEVHAGDIVPADGVPDDEKHQREEDSLRRVVGDLPGGESYIELWREYAEGRSPEARLLRQLDRLEMGIQAVVYERQGAVDAGEFLGSAGAALRSKRLRALLDDLTLLRPPSADTAPRR